MAVLHHTKPYDPWQKMNSIKNKMVNTCLKMITEGGGSVWRKMLKVLIRFSRLPRPAAPILLIPLSLPFVFVKSTLEEKIHFSLVSLSHFTP